MSSKWEGWPMLGFDLESTGIDPHTDRIVTAAVHAVWEYGGQRRQQTRTYITDPGIEIPEGAAQVHGYTRARAIAEQTHTPEQLLAEITGRLALAMGKGIPVVGANISYDLTMLEAENRRHGVDTLIDRLGPGKVQPVIDVMVLDKHASFRKGPRKLTNLCEHYGVTLGDDAHDSGADARAACELWPKIMAAHRKKFPDSFTIHALHQAQVGWRQAQMNSLRGYFDKTGREHDGCCGEWPIHRTCAPKPTPAPAAPPAPQPPPF